MAPKQGGKKVANKLSLVLPAGKANPAPPVGPILGQNGIDIQAFCTEFNDKTKDQMGDELPVMITVFEDRSFKMVIKQPTVTSMLKKKLSINKGSAQPNNDKVAKVRKSDLKDIAEKKMPDFNTGNIDSAINIVAGVAKSMGIEVID